MNDKPEQCDQCGKTAECYELEIIPRDRQGKVLDRKTFQICEDCAVALLERIAEDCAVALLERIAEAAGKERVS